MTETKCGVPWCRSMAYPGSEWCQFHEVVNPFVDTPSPEDEEPEPDGECYRGGEAAGALAEEQAHIQRELKR